MRYQLAMYDWNGTLAEDPEICHASALEILRTFAPDVQPPDFSAWRAGNNNANFWEFYYAAGVPRSVPIQAMRDVWTHHYRSFAESKKLGVRDGAERLLKFCQAEAVPNVIVSSSIDDIEVFLRGCNVHHFFHTIKVRVAHKKSALADMADHHCVAPERAFYIDDTRDGLLHAKEAGITTFGITGGCNNEETVRSAEPDYLVRSFHEIVDILEKDDS